MNRVTPQKIATPAIKFMLCLAAVGLMTSSPLAMPPPAKKQSPAVRELIKKANAGEAEAQLQLAYHYTEGQGVKQSWKQALKWLRKAADNGHPSAQYELGTAYAKGENVSKNLIAAHYWISQAAAQNDEYAQLQLSQLEQQMTSTQLKKSRQYQP